MLYQGSIVSFAISTIQFWKIPRHLRRPTRYKVHRYLAYIHDGRQTHSGLAGTRYRKQNSLDVSPCVLQYAIISALFLIHVLYHMHHFTARHDQALFVIGLVL